MRYGPEHKEATRESIVDAAGRVFRAQGFGGAGVEALTASAGVTNGGFYGHFRTKADAFRIVMVAAIERLAGQAAALQQTRGPDWLGPFIDDYFDEAVAGELADGSALALLSPDVARADERVRGAFQCAFRILVSTVAAGLGGDQGRAMAILAQLSGAAALARAVENAAMRRDVVAAARSAVLQLAAGAAPVRIGARPGPAMRGPEVVGRRAG